MFDAYSSSENCKNYESYISSFEFNLYNPILGMGFKNLAKCQEILQNVQSSIENYGGELLTLYQEQKSYFTLKAGFLKHNLETFDTKEKFLENLSSLSLSRNEKITKECEPFEPLYFIELSTSDESKTYTYETEEKCMKLLQIFKNNGFEENGSIIKSCEKNNIDYLGDKKLM